MQIPAFVSVHKIATCARPHPPHLTHVHTQLFQFVASFQFFFLTKDKTLVTPVCY